MKKNFMLVLACAVMLPLMVQCQDSPSQTKIEQASTSPVASQGADHYPARPGFQIDSSDTKAIEIAENVVKNMGGYQAWDNSRYVAWSYYGQYQIWDKHTGYFRHEQNGTITILNLNEPEGKVFINGIERTNEDEVKSMLRRAYIFWATNAYVLALPYKLKDSGLILKYAGEGQTKENKPADILDLTFGKVGITPTNRHQVWVDKQSGLITQWAFYSERHQEEPSFVRRFDDYKQYGPVKLSTNRDSDTDKLRITDLVVTNDIDEKIFYSTTPVNKALIK